MPPSDHTVPFVRATDIKEGEIQTGGLLHVHRDQPSQMAKCLLRKGEVIVVRSGVNTGDCAPVPASLAGAYAAYDLILRLREGAESVLPGFLTAYLDIRVGRAQLNVLKARSAQPHLNAEEIGSIRVALPRPTKQRELMAGLDNARTARRHGLQAADDLLVGLDGFVLDQLGLTLLPPNTHRTTYAVSLRDVLAGKKLYPDYFHPERTNAIKSIQAKYSGNRSATLLSIAEFHRDQRNVKSDDDYLGLANVQSNTGERIESSEEDGEGNVFTYAENDVLFARLRPYLNKIYRAEKSGVCSTEFHVMRIRKKADGTPVVLPDYLAAVLRSSIVLAQTRHMMTGNTHPRLANEDVINLVVPVPGSKVQERISDEVEHRRKEARRLRIEAAQIWNDAKRRFEEALLGPVSNTDQSKAVVVKKGKAE